MKLNSPTDNCKIYDINSNEIANLGESFFEFIRIENVSIHIINAFLSVEDQEYYEHHGVNYKRILQSIYNNIKEGEIVSGASTITQQLIKNVFLSSDKTLSRKIQEIALALKLDNMYTKNQILEAYLNTILFGGNIYGIKMAAKHYFNKDPIGLSISEAAMLAGLIKSPNYYNPFKNPEIANERKNLVVRQMFEEGYITKSEYDHEVALPIAGQLEKGIIKSNIPYLASYLDYVYYYMNENLHEEVITPNQKIKTYLHPEIQMELYKIIQNDFNYYNDARIKTGIVVLDNDTGGVLGIMGNKDTNRLVINYANTKVQVGSTIKPILDYGPVLEYLNYSPSTIVVDEPYSYSTGEAIKNWDNLFKGPMTLRDALSESRNIPALKMFQAVGPKKAKAFAGNLGLETQEPFYEAEAIGGSYTGYTLINIANAYQAFANLGYRVVASPIQEIVSTYKHDSAKKLVMKPSTAFLINSMLHDVFKGSTYDLKDSYLMAKTGQTNYDSKTRTRYNIPFNATKDSLVIAYTKSITIGIYVSFDIVSENTYLDSKQKQIPRTIMKHLLTKFAKKNEYYQIPDNITSLKIYQDDDNIYLAKGNEIGSYYEYFIKCY